MQRCVKTIAVEPVFKEELTRGRLPTVIINTKLKEEEKKKKKKRRGHAADNRPKLLFLSGCLCLCLSLVLTAAIGFYEAAGQDEGEGDEGGAAVKLLAEP